MGTGHSQNPLGPHEFHIYNGKECFLNMVNGYFMKLNISPVYFFCFFSGGMSLMTYLDYNCLMGKVLTK